MDSPTRMMQENLLTLLCWSSKDQAKVIQNCIEWRLFEGQYREIAKRIYSYLDKYNRPPGDHIADLFQEELEGEDKRKAYAWHSLLMQIHEARESIDNDFIMERLEIFVRMQRLREGIILSADKLRSGGELSLDEAEEILIASTKKALSAFNPGIQLSNKQQVIQALESISTPSFHTGISQLDTRNLGPTRKELHLFIAPKGRGKSWWLTHLGKTISSIDRAKVLHVTLELSARQTVGRYMQSLFSVAKHEGTFNSITFTSDKKEWELDSEKVEIPLTFKQPDFLQIIGEKVDDFEQRLKRIYVKEFPTDGLTITSLNAFMDALENRLKWVPDVLLLDYADLMSINVKDYRIDLGSLYKKLRGLAVERNIAVVTATQTHRAGATAKHVRSTNVGEDWSKVQTADTVITYSQTPEEKGLGLARLMVEHSRAQEDGITLLITQSYPIGQFVIDSHMMDNTYWDKIKNGSNGGKEGEDKEGGENEEK